MKWFVDAMNSYWLSVLLIAGLLVAIRYVWKNKKKYENNEFE
ncbi:hypothetical protein [Paenibacillus flagellatus]|nr:hypothetical protein [Paenibacillus flagellatus]